MKLNEKLLKSCEKTKENSIDFWYFKLMLQIWQRRLWQSNQYMYQ